MMRGRLLTLAAAFSVVVALAAPDVPYCVASAPFAKTGLP
jgi:hypothetical protein